MRSLNSSDSLYLVFFAALRDGARRFFIRERVYRIARLFEVEREDVVVHEKSVSYVEIPLGVFVHSAFFVEILGRFIASIDV